MENTQSDTMYVDLADLRKYDQQLANVITSQFHRFYPAVQTAVYNTMRQTHPAYVGIVGVGLSSEDAHRTFHVSFFDSAEKSPQSIRELDCSDIQRLVTVTATVTRVTDVRPELAEAVFECRVCGAEVAEPQEFAYTEPTVCPNPDCHNVTDWARINERSRFVDF